MSCSRLLQAEFFAVGYPSLDDKELSEPSHMNDNPSINPNPGGTKLKTLSGLQVSCVVRSVSTFHLCKFRVLMRRYASCADQVRSTSL
jgi:hypothetical protein